jgi:probable HAF family extracellular repeat protein
VWLNDGKGNFRDSGLRLGNAFSWDVALGDINGDGKLDAFVANLRIADNTKNPPVFGGAPAEIWLNTVPRTNRPSFAVSSSSPQSVSFQGLGDFSGGTFESSALRVSADGSVIVGYGTTAAGKQAFRWTQSDGMVSLGNLPDHSFKQSEARGVSADGAVVVGSGNPVGSGWDSNQGFRWTQNGGMVKVGSLDGSARYEAFGVSADGSVVVGDGGSQAFRWTQSGGIAGLGVLPGRTNSRAIAVSADGSVVTGSSYNLPSWDKEEAFVWTQAGGMQGLGFLPGGSTSFPNAISADGSVIAGTSNSSSGWSAFRWTRSAGMVDIGHLPGTKITHPGAVSADGSIIVGASFVDRDHGTAFIWDAARGMRSLQSVLETDCGLNLTGWHLQNASGITPDGSVIVGWGKNPSGQQEAFRAVLGEVIGK